MEVKPCRNTEETQTIFSTSNSETYFTPTSAPFSGPVCSPPPSPPPTPVLYRCLLRQEMISASLVPSVQSGMKSHSSLIRTVGAVPLSRVKKSRKHKLAQSWRIPSHG